MTASSVILPVDSTVPGDVAPVDLVETAPERRRVPLWVAIVAASLPMFMATLDNLVLTSALARHPGRSRLVGRPAVVVPQRLHAGVRDVHASGRHVG